MKKPQIDVRPTRPLLRWAGGKRWLIPTLLAAVEKYRVDEYVEPFVGSGACFFGATWPKARLADINAELIATYRAVASSPAEVSKRLRALVVSRDVFDRIRVSRPRTDVSRAVRLIYLNRTAWAGLYRTNKGGDFNVPYSGDRDLRSVGALDRLSNLSDVLTKATLTESDFEKTMATAGKGSVVFCDPVYQQSGAREVFSRYDSSGFSWSEQERLVSAAGRASTAGALVVVSNLSDPKLSRLYRGAVAIDFNRANPLPNARGTCRVETVYFLGSRQILAHVGSRLTGAYRVR